MSSTYAGLFTRSDLRSRWQARSAPGSVFRFPSPDGVSGGSGRPSRRTGDAGGGRARRAHRLLLLVASPHPGVAGWRHACRLGRKEEERQPRENTSPLRSAPSRAVRQGSGVAPRQEAWARRASCCCSSGGWPESCGSGGARGHRRSVLFLDVRHFAVRGELAIAATTHPHDRVVKPRAVRGS